MNLRYTNGQNKNELTIVGWWVILKLEIDDKKKIQVCVLYNNYVRVDSRSRLKVKARH